MKLSCRRRLGWTHVRGGRVVRVRMPHAVRTITRSELADEVQPDGQQDADWVYTEVGDVALEIIVRKTGMCLGYSYLSGPALQLNRYKLRALEEPLEASWYEDIGDVGLIEIPLPTPGTKPRDFFESVVGTLMKAKYSDAHYVSALHYRCAKDEDPKEVARALVTMFSYEGKDMTSSAHVLGLIQGKRKRGEHVTLHFQPPHHAAKWHATSFQVQLAITAAEASHK